MATKVTFIERANRNSALGIVQRYHPEVTKVMDAKKNITIEVTEADRTAGSKKEPGACALARACERSYDGAIISTSTIYLVKGRTAFRFRPPESVSREIVSFDRGHDFAPGQYSLRAPGKTERLGHRGHPPGGHSKKAKPRARAHRTTGIRVL